jgi:hypothetical protein
MRTTSRLARAAALVVLAFGAGGPAAAEATRVVIVSKCAAGDVVRRTVLRDSTVRLEEDDKTTEYVTSRAYDASVSVVRPHGASGGERLLVEWPRAITTSSVSGAKTSVAPPSFDPRHGATVRYDRDADAWKTTPVAGPTSAPLLNWLARPRADPLRRALVPQGEMFVGQTVRLSDGVVRETLEEMIPLEDLKTQALMLRLERVDGEGDAAVARFVGSTKVNGTTVIPTFHDVPLDWDLTIVEDVAVADGRLLSVTITGSFKMQVVQMPRMVSAAFEMSVSEIATLAAPGAPYVRPRDAWTPVKTLAPVFDDRPWNVAFHRLVPEPARTSKTAITEWTLDGERLTEGSEEGWTELVATQRDAFPGPGGPPSLTDFAEAQRREIVRAEPKVTWKTVRSGADELVYEWTLKGGKGFADQHEMGRFVRLPDAVLRVRYVKKTPQLAAGDRTAWLERLAAAKVVGDK